MSFCLIIITVYYPLSSGLTSLVRSIRSEEICGRIIVGEEKGVGPLTKPPQLKEYRQGWRIILLLLPDLGLFKKFLGFLLEVRRGGEEVGGGKGGEIFIHAKTK